MILDVSQRDLARRAGISVRELSRIEKGEVMPKREAAAALDRAFKQIIQARAAEDRADVAVARKRLRELAEHPERVVGGDALAKKLKELETA